jgi:hypothetical protein
MNQDPIIPVISYPVDDLAWAWAWAWEGITWLEL